MICLILNLTFEEIATLMMNSIKRTIDGVEKTPTEYKFHLDGDIFAVVNVFKTYRLYTFDIIETRHIHWMGYVITQTILKIL